jgi:NAD-dependent dihydropyrimidine dehydrogenase PreA subunit
MFEFQVNRLNRKFAELFYAYEEEGFFDSLFRMKTHQMRTIPVNVAIEHRHVVGNYDDIRQIVKDSPGPFALMNCVCRQAKDLMKEPCRLTDHRETCITLEDAASHMIRRGVARELYREELLKYLTWAKKEGLVLQPENIQHPTFICCCCGCCCGILNSAVKYDRPAEYLHSNFRSEVDTGRCDGCEDCVDRCQMEAIKKVNGYVEILNERCIGCGVCIPVCKQRAMKLVKKAEEKVPPVNENEMYKRMMLERFGRIKTVGMVIKSKVGMKV